MLLTNKPLIGLGMITASLTSYQTLAGQQVDEMFSPAKQIGVHNTLNRASSALPEGAICGSDDNGQNWQQLQVSTKRELKQSFAKSKLAQATKIPASANSVAAAGRYYIPVVVHVYGDKFNCEQGSKCLSDNDIIDALNKTNEDFRGLNTQDGPIAPEFAAIRDNLDIEFVLAQKTPDGTSTNGIVRYDHEQAGYGENETFNAQIAADSWDNYSYMNIYIMNDLHDDGTLNNSGIAWYPQTSMSDEGLARVVYNGAYVGKNTDENFRSVLTHEFGHWLNLPHTFEDKSCSLDNETFCALSGDRSCDTPQMSLSSVMKDNAQNCLGQTTNTENFMHYTDNYAMYTEDQVERMTAALHGPTRSTLWSNENLNATGLSIYTSNDPHHWDGSGVDQAPAGELLHRKTAISGAKDDIDVFAFDIPANTPAVAFYLDGYDQDPDMYISKGAASTAPDANNSDWVADHISFNSPGQAEFTGILSPSETEQYFVSVHAFSAYDNAQLQVISVEDPNLCSGCTRVSLHHSQNLNAAENDQPRTYSFEVPEDAEHVVFVMPAGYTGDPDLHVSRNKPVSLESYDCRPFSAPQLAEYCDFDQGGTFNVMIDPFLFYNNASFEVYYQTKGGTNLPPTASTNGTYSGITNQAVSFSSAGSNDADGSIVEYLWDFGNGATSTLANPQNTFTAAGIYDVSLTVTDNDGSAVTATTIAQITAPGPVIDDVCASQSPLATREIQAGQTECLPQQSRVSITIADVNAHSSIAITLAHGQGNGDVYYRQGRWPSTSNNDGASTNPGNNECIYIDNINQNGSYWGYIEVNGAAQDASFVVDFDTPGCRTAP